MTDQIQNGEDDDTKCEKIEDAVNAIMSIVSMLKPDLNDGFNAVGISLGLMLWQSVKEEHIDEVLAGLSGQAKSFFYKEKKEKEAIERIAQSAVEAISEYSEELGQILKSQKSKTHH